MNSGQRQLLLRAMASNYPTSRSPLVHTTSELFRPHSYDGLELGRLYCRWSETLCLPHPLLEQRTMHWHQHRERQPLGEQQRRLLRLRKRVRDRRVSQVRYWRRVQPDHPELQQASLIHHADGYERQPGICSSRHRRENEAARVRRIKTTDW